MTFMTAYENWWRLTPNNLSFKPNPTGYRISTAVKFPKIKLKLLYGTQKRDHVTKSNYLTTIYLLFGRTLIECRKSRKTTTLRPGC